MVIFPALVKIYSTEYYMYISDVKVHVAALCEIFVQ